MGTKTSSPALLCSDSVLWETKYSEQQQDPRTCQQSFTFFLLLGFQLSSNHSNKTSEGLSFTECLPGARYCTNSFKYRSSGSSYQSPTWQMQL